jgi:acyl-coenzyme A thioesterase PaaI-like protein
MRLEDDVRSRVRPRPELTNSWGGAHGGLIVTLLDASMTVAARYSLLATEKGRRDYRSDDAIHRSRDDMLGVDYCRVDARAYRCTRPKHF